MTEKPFPELGCYGLASVFGCAYGTRTERGDRMFAAMVARACAAIRDLGTLELVAAQ